LSMSHLRRLNLIHRTLISASRPASTLTMPQAPKINRVSPLSADEAKWTELRKIEWSDQDGKQRVWEAAARKTRKSTGVDAVAIVPILKHPSKPVSTMIIVQYRPPVEAFCVEFPAGLIDEGESPEQAAVRELREETGYSGKMVTVEVDLKEGDEEPEQHLDDGEHIERVVVPISELYEKLQAMSKEQGKIVDARLFHWALGLHWSQRLL